MIIEFEGIQIFCKSFSAQLLLNKIADCALKKYNVYLWGNRYTGRKMFAKYLHKSSGRKEFYIMKKSNIDYSKIPEKGTLVIYEVDDFKIEDLKFIIECCEDKKTRIISISSLSSSDLLSQFGCTSLIETLTVAPILVPSLQARHEDIYYFIQKYFKDYSADEEKTIYVPQEVIIRIYNQYSTSGNLKDLQNLIKRIVMKTDNRTEAKMVYLYNGNVEEATRFLTFDEIEKSTILRYLAEFKNNRTHTARALGISVRRLRNKLKKFGINKDVKE